MTEVSVEKNSLRKQMKVVRENVTERKEKSQQILSQVYSKFLEVPKTVCVFVSKHPEVETQVWIRTLLEDSEHQVVVPYCSGEILKLFQLTSWDQLADSQFGLLEPRTELRVQDNLIAPEDIDLFLVPGLAFDLHGNRLGYGKGFYDRLLKGKKADAPAVALAFEEQVVESVPSDEDWDQTMDFIQTEVQLLECKR